MVIFMNGVLMFYFLGLSANVRFGEWDWWQGEAVMV